MTFKQWQRQAQVLTRQLLALSLLVKDGRLKWWLKLLFTVVLAYALSPIDLIPDFIPVIGYLDELLLLPLAIWCLLRFVPDHIWQECQMLAARQTSILASNYGAACIIALIWCVLIIWAMQWIVLG